MLDEFEARSRILTAATPAAAEAVPIREALGGYAAEDVLATVATFLDSLNAPNRRSAGPADAGGWSAPMFLMPRAVLASDAPATRFAEGFGLEATRVEELVRNPGRLVIDPLIGGAYSTGRIVDLDELPLDGSQRVRGWRDQVHQAPGQQRSTSRQNGLGRQF